MNVGRVSVIASNVFREVIRDRVLYLIGFFAVLFIAASTLIPYVSASAEEQILADLGLAAIGILSLVIAVFVGTGLVNKEIEKRTVFVLIAKPISYGEFIVGKHLGLSAVLAVLVLTMTAIYLVVLSVYGIPYPIGSVLIAAFYQFLELSLITAVAILFGVFTSSLLATLFTFAVYLMGHLSRDLLTLGNLAKSESIQQVTQALYLVLPDLERLNLKNQAVYGIELLPQPLELAANATYGVFYTALLLAIAVLIFSRRQF
ncbi:ABC transporter permease [Oscillatoria sp. FACHB-1407]|uniref:ABC transporter permease n=1 Tax=Oscillatoria sp. FACHB-1407 TaxID=2692847 RepID=UPI001683CF54|nr:ABC transporter permease [Oscillatoria sp. FACHB-1407]MBD2464878.1 ABC transporter permease [Oscillatoria sp. FACHB-1407]